MKIVVDIDNDLYTWLFDNGDEHVTDMHRACASIRKGKPLPEGATNGDMIKAMFPNIKVRNSYYTYAVEVKLEYHRKPDTGLLFDKKWWNSPYKAESEKETCQM